MPPKARPLKSHHLITLVELYRCKSGRTRLELTSSELGRRLEISQQAASKRLADLERSGFIERLRSGRSTRVRITGAGYEAVRSFYGELKSAFEKERKDVVFTGEVFTGLREGGYYISLKGYSDQFQARLGFVPFPGTLNLKLSSPTQIEERRRLEFLGGIEIPGFEDEDRTYGPVKCFRAEIGGRLKGAVLAIERTHHDTSVLEVISPVELRRALRLKDGDQCSVAVHFE